MEVLLFGLSYYYAAVEMETLVFLTMVVAVADVTAAIVVFGLSFFFSSAVADVAETDSANSMIKGGEYFAASFIAFSYFSDLHLFAFRSF